jgi:hypothetical protein
LHDIRIHKLVYLGAIPSRRPITTSVFPPDFDIVRICFEEPFGPASPRHPSDLTRLAYIVLEGLRRSLLPRTGNREAMTALQQWLFSFILHQFDIVDFLICEIEVVCRGSDCRMQTSICTYHTLLACSLYCAYG